MKHKIIKLLLILVFMLVITSVSTKLKALIDEPGFAEAGSQTLTPLQINTPYNLTLSYGTEKGFKVDFTDTEKYYVIETWGDADTKLVLSGGMYGSSYKIDYNSGVDNNAYVETLSTGTVSNPSTMYIYLSLETNCPVTNTTIIVREETASIFGFEYDNSRTNTDELVDFPYNALSNNYNATRYINADVVDLSNLDARGIEIFDSEIMIIMGHGESSFSFKGEGMVFYDGSVLNKLEYVYSTTNYAKFVMFAGCETAGATYGEDIASIAVESGGVDCTMGFAEKITPAGLKHYIKKFFEKLADKVTIKEANEFAATRSLFFPAVYRSTKVYGNGDIRLLPTSTAASRSGSVVDLSMLYEYQERKLSLPFEFDQISEHYNRQCFIYNNYLTTDFYQFQYDEEGNMIRAEHSGSYFNPDNVLPILITSTPTPTIAEIGGDVYTTLTGTESFIIYHTINNVSVPIEIKYCDYYNSQNNVVMREAFCTNLYSGESVNYEDLLEF